MEQNCRKMPNDLWDFEKYKRSEMDKNNLLLTTRASCEVEFFDDMGQLSQLLNHEKFRVL